MNQDKQLELELEKYYKISMFVNRYMFLIGSFVISVIIMLAFNIKEYKVLAYDNQGLVNDILSDDRPAAIGKNTSDFNEQSNFIKSNLLFTDSKVNEDSIDLGVGIFRDKFGIPYPMNIQLSNNIDVKTKEQALTRYISTLQNSKQLSYSVKKPKLNPKSDSEIIEDYSLSCMGTYLNGTIFCNANKNKLVGDLITKNSLEISKNLYEKLFKSLSFSDLQKCNVLKAIYSEKYNFDDIKNIISETQDCSLSEFENANNFLTNVAFGSYEDLFNIDYENSKNYNVLQSKLIQQLYVLLHQKEIPDYMMTNNYSFVRELIKTGNMDSSLAFITKSTYNRIKNNKDFRKKISFTKLSIDMKSVIEGDKVANIKGLNTLINNKSLLAVSDSNDDGFIHASAGGVSSEREKAIKILKDRYGKIFTPTKTIKYDSKTKSVHVQGDLHLYFTVGGQNSKTDTEISFEIKNIVGTNFDIVNLKFIDRKIENYLKSNNANVETSSLLSLQEDLQTKLYGPLINNNFGGTDNIDVCKKYTQLNGNFPCSNGQIKASIDNANLEGNLFMLVDIDKNQNITNLNLNKDSVKYNLNNILEDEIDINLTSLSKYLSLLSKKKSFNVKNISNIKKITENKIKQYIENGIQKYSGLSKKQVIDLNSRFEKYFKTNIMFVKKNGKYNDLYFNLKGTVYYLSFYLGKNLVNGISIYSQNNKKVYTFKNTNFRMSNLDLEKINNFISKPLEYLKSKDSTTYSEYNTYLEKNK